MSSVPTPAERYLQHPQVETLQRWLQNAGQPLLLKGLAGSSTALVAGALGDQHPQLLVLSDKEAAAYLYHDLV